jgi:uncharacterized protein with HEPN domain
MPRDYKVSVDDILEAIAKIKRFTVGFDSKTFSDDEKTFDAVIRNLEVIGEAVKKIPEEIRTQYPTVEWKKIAGVRDILIHEYLGSMPRLCGISLRTSCRSWKVTSRKLQSLDVPA